MSLTIDFIALEKAKQECLERKENFTPKAEEHCLQDLQIISQPKTTKQGYCNVTWDEMLCWDEVPVGSVTKQLCPPYVAELSKTGFAFRECGENGTWINPDQETNVTNGWTNYTDCFKEDPLFASIKHDIPRIELMSRIGYAISLVSLVVAVLIMCLSRRLHCKSNSLHINLFIAFIIRAVVSLLKDVLFVEGLGLEKDVVQVSDYKWKFQENGLHWECKLIVTVLMYAVAASMMWIFMEGLYLHMLVYKTLFTERTGIRMYVIIGWLSPFLYIIPWVLVRIFVDNTLCWNTDSFYLSWIVRSPIMVTIVINFVFFINIIRVLCIRMKTHRNTKGNNQQVSRIFAGLSKVNECFTLTMLLALCSIMFVCFCMLYFRVVGKLAKFSLVLIPLFGVFYIGTSAYPIGMDVKADMIYLYLDMFYNSFQGVLLAILFCFLNEEVHNEVRRCWYRHRQTDSVFTRTFTLSSYRKGSSMSQPSNAQANHKSTKKLLSEKRFKDNLDETSTHKNGAKVYTSTCLNGTNFARSNRYENMSECEQIRPLMD